MEFKFSVSTVELDNRRSSASRTSRYSLGAYYFSHYISLWNSKMISTVPMRYPFLGKVPSTFFVSTQRLQVTKCHIAQGLKNLSKWHSKLVTDRKNTFLYLANSSFSSSVWKVIWNRYHNKDFSNTFWICIFKYEYNEKILGFFSFLKHLC